MPSLLEQCHRWLNENTTTAATTKAKRRVKPTVIAHIGLPSNIAHAPRPTSTKPNTAYDSDQQQLIETLKQIQLGEQDYEQAREWLAQDPCIILETLPILLETLVRVKVPEAQPLLASVRWCLVEWAERALPVTPRLVEALGQLKWLGMSTLLRRSTGGSGWRAVGNDVKCGVGEDEFAMAYATHGLDQRATGLTASLHSNRQRVRDLSIDWLRSCNPLNNSTLLRQLQNRARGIMALVHNDNVPWLASLLLEQMLMRREQQQRQQPSDKLDKLEARMMSRADEADDPVILFLQLVDSHRLHQAMLQLIEERIEGEEQDLQRGQGRTRLLSVIGRLKLMAKLGSSLDYAWMQQLAQRRLHLALQSQHLLVTVPWCQSVLGPSHFTWSTVRTKVAACCWTVPSAMAILLSIPPLSGKTLSSESSEFVSLDEFIPLDLDMSVDFHGWLLKHCPVYSNCHSFLERLKVTGFITEKTAVSPPSAPKRVIRPSTTAKPMIVAGSADEARLQARLRYWFWWPWGPLKEILEASVRWIAQECSDIDDDRISGLLQSLTPKLLSHPRWLEIANGLLREQLDREMQSRIGSDELLGVDNVDGDDDVAE